MSQIPRKRYQVSTLGVLNADIPFHFTSVKSFDSLEEAKKYITEKNLNNSAIIDFIDGSPNVDAQGKLVYVKYPEYRLEKIT